MIGLSRIVDVRDRNEARAMWWSCAYFFCVMAGYFILRPIRDDMGVAGGVRNLSWLFTAIFLYFQQAEIVAADSADRTARTIFFARIDLAVNILTVLTQLFLTGRIIRWLGVAVTLAVLPAVCLIGFIGIGAAPLALLWLGLGLWLGRRQEQQATASRGR